MNKPLLGSPDSLKSTVELDGIASIIEKDLLLQSASSKQIKYEITLLEIFDFEVKKLQKINYCDYELAYVTYQTASRLFTRIEVNEKTKDFLISIKQTLFKKAHSFELIRNFLRSSAKVSSGVSSDDPLLARFNNLNQSPSPSPAKSSGKFITSDSISPKELQPLLNDSVLLIDYRETKDFNHNHINHSQIINIQPSILSYKYTSDQDLESKLKLHLPEDQFKRFQNRYKYELVVIYNFRFGFELSALGQHLVADDKEILPSSGPFSKLIDLIMFQNKYISSKLKHYPIYLQGGILNWYNTLGEKSIKRAEMIPILPPPASLSRNGTSTSVKVEEDRAQTASPYLKNFGDYLSTAKSEPSSGSYSAIVSTTSSFDTSSSFKYYTDSKKENKESTKKTYTDSKPKVSQTLPEQQPIAPKRTLSFKGTTSTAVTQAKPQNSEKGPNMLLEKYTTGLVNLGNSCYMNCIVQCLGATPQLTSFFFPNLSNTSNSLSYRQHININNKLGTKGILTNNFVGLLINMFTNNSKYFSPADFKRVIGSLSPGQQFATYDQQDCNEFLTFILDSLHEDLNQMVILNPEEKKQISELTPEQEKTREYLPVRLASTIEWERYLKLNFSVIVDYFQGQYLSQLKCLECQTTSTTYNAFSVLSLPIPRSLSSNKDVLLDDCLREFTTTELLDDNNRWRCSHCKRQTRLTKKISITRLPQVLIIHFKRFKITPEGYFNKLDTFVKYPVSEVLDLTKYWPEVGTSMSSAQTYTKERESQILSTLPTRNQIPPFRYKLNAVANHYGNLTTGHYTAYVHKESDSKKTRGWCYFDDAKITYNCAESQVLNKNAYCLFYLRV